MMMMMIMLIDDYCDGSDNDLRDDVITLSHNYYVLLCRSGDV